MRIQLWSYNYDPEQLGIAPVSTTFAREMASRGHELTVVAAHPHYPEPEWGAKVIPYREERDGIPVLRLPIWPGRRSAVQRVRQELSFVGPLTAAVPFLPRADVIVAASPSFPALGPARAFARLKRIPWALWLHDILPDGAVSSGVLSEGWLIGAARRFERRSYDSAAAVVVLSEVFRQNLIDKEVDTGKIHRIYNPVTRPLPPRPREPDMVEPATIICIGNIGHTQNLVDVVRRFESSGELEGLGARLVITGDGVAAPEVRATITTDRVEMRGVVSPQELDELLARATIGLVSSTYSGSEFNIPSKLMNYMGHGLPVVAAVGSGSEVAHIVSESGCGWIASEAEQLTSIMAAALSDVAERHDRGRAGHSFAAEHFSPREFGDQFDALLAKLASR